LQYDLELQNTVQMLNEASIQTREAANELRHYLGSLETEPGRLEYLNDRLTVLHDLSRKHHVSPNQLMSLLTQMQAELEQLQSTGERSNHLDADINRLEVRFNELSKKLSQARRKAAKLLADAVAQNMQQLGMKAGKFAIEISPLEQPSSTGLDRIEFQVSANPGEPIKPLTKVASGGELSRISLAIQVITAGTGRIPTLIFDEVDVGIGGGTAEVVGILLRNLSKSRQVLCVTHQPQVATQADHHLRVVKYTERNETQTDVIHLTPEQRVDEIARMLGGVEITEQTLSHAQEMLDRASAASIA
jgi:DNA repair protein RecN (Recombination protein N)